MNELYLKSCEKFAKMDGMKSLESLLAPFIMSKSNAMYKIDEYLKKYNIAGIEQIVSMFDKCFKKMQQANLSILENNINLTRPTAERQVTEQELGVANKSASYVITNNQGDLQECNISNPENNYSVELMNGEILPADKKYIAVYCSPKELKIIYNVNLDKRLIIESNNNQITIEETNNGKQIVEDYCVWPKDSYTVKHTKNSDVTEIEEY